MPGRICMNVDLFLSPVTRSVEFSMKCVYILHTPSSSDTFERWTLIYLSSKLYVFNFSQQSVCRSRMLPAHYICMYVCMFVCLTACQCSWLFGLAVCLSACLSIRLFICQSVISACKPLKSVSVCQSFGSFVSFWETTGVFYFSSSFICV